MDLTNDPESPDMKPKVQCVYKNAVPEIRHDETTAHVTMQTTKIYANDNLNCHNPLKGLTYAEQVEF